MNSIEKLIEELCPEGVAGRAIGSFAACVVGATPSSGVSDYWDGGDIPWMSSGEVNRKTITYTDKSITQKGFNSSSTKLVPPDSVVIALAGQGKTRGLVAITRIALCTNQSLCAMTCDSTVLPEYFFHFLSSRYLELRGISAGEGGRGGLNLQIIRNYSLPIPPLEVQREIVSILDKFTQLEAELEAELEARKKQYEALRSMYLDFDLEINVNPLSEKIRELCPEGVEHKILEDIFDVKGGYTPSKSVEEYWGSEDVPWLRMEDIRKSGRILRSSIQSVSYGAVKSKGLFEKNSLIVATTATIGEHALVEMDFLANQQFSILTINEKHKGKLIPKFTYYLGFNLSEFCKANTNVSGFASVNMERFKRFCFPIPPLEIQKEIVEILDNLESMTTSLSSGLPAEIAARRKQYEYYRDKLMTFKELKSA